MPSPCEWLKPQDVAVRLKLSQNVVVHSCLRGAEAAHLVVIQERRRRQRTRRTLRTDRGGTRGRVEQKGAGSFATSDVANQVAAVGRDQSLTSERRGSRRAWLWEPPCLPFLSLKTFFSLSLFLRLGRSREGLCIFRHKKKKKNPQNFHFEKADVVPCVPLPPQELIPQTAVELWSGRSWSGAFPGTAGIKIPVA